MSFETNSAGNRVIDASELARVYGVDQHDFAREQGATTTNKASRIESSSLQNANAIRDQYEARIEQYAAVIDRLEKELDQAHARDRENQESYRQSLRLLEDQSAKAGRGEEWKAAIAAMEEKLANQEQEFTSRSEHRIRELEESHKKRILRMKEELEVQRNKTLWQRLFP